MAVPYTVFAPSNEALEAAIDFDTLDEISNADILTFLTYHVVAGKVMSSDIEDGSFVQTLQGERVAFDVEEYGIVVNDAKVVIADIEASNGVVHVIDKVLYPQALLNAPSAGAAVRGINFSTPSPTESPVAPVEEDPVAEEPVAEDPVAEEPVEPVEPVEEDPVAEEPVEPVEP